MLLEKIADRQQHDRLIINQKDVPRLNPHALRLILSRLNASVIPRLYLRPALSSKNSAAMTGSGSTSLPESRKFPTAPRFAAAATAFVRQFEFVCVILPPTARKPLVLLPPDSSFPADQTSNHKAPAAQTDCPAAISSRL